MNPARVVTLGQLLTLVFPVLGLAISRPAAIMNALHFSAMYLRNLAFTEQLAHNNRAKHNEQTIYE